MHEAGRDEATPRLMWTAARALAGLVAFAGLVAVLYVVSVHAAPGNSDGATVILEGRSFSGGDVLLNHWALSLDSFWLVDVLLYAIATAVGGVRPELLHLVPAVAAAAVVLLGAWLAQRGRARLGAIAACATVIVLLALPTHAFAQFFVMGPLHVVTVLWSLAAFTALRRQRFGAGWVVAVVLLAAGLLGDLQAVILGVAPVFVAGGALALRTRSIRTGIPAMSAAVSSIVLAVVVRLLAVAIGSFTISVNPSPGLSQMISNLRAVPRNLAALGGVGTGPFGGSRIPPLVEAAHGFELAVIFAAVVAGVVVLVRGAVSGGDRTLADAPRALEGIWLSDVLTLGFFAGCAVYVGLSFSDAGAYGRYLTGGVVLGAVLAGRWVGVVADHVGSRDRQSPMAWSARSGAAAALLAAALVVTGSAAGFASTLEAAPPHQDALELARFLERHGLDRGLGDYWSSSIVSVESDGRVSVRPVIAEGTRLVRYRRNSESPWYTGTFGFLVFDKREPWGGVGKASAVASYGSPEHIDRIGPYRIYIWRHRISVLASLPG